jgi:hypothetical protein
MKKLAGAVLVLVAVWALAATYRSYRARVETQLNARRNAIVEREAESRHRAEAEQEALRLKEMQAQQEAAEAERRIAELRAQQEAADAANAEREAQAARWEAELDRLRREKLAAEGEARQLADQRHDEIARLKAAEVDALAKLRDVELGRAASRDRDAQRAAALAHQLEVEKRARDELARLRSRPAR